MGSGKAVLSAIVGMIFQACVVEVNEVNTGDAPGIPDQGIPINDNTAPTITAFLMPGNASSVSVAITQFTANDNVGVTGYQLTLSPSAPSSVAAGWSSSPPSQFSFPGAGNYLVYAWAKDAAGNVSAGKSASVRVVLSSEPAVLYHTSFEDVQDWTQNRPARNTSGYSWPNTWSGQNNGNPMFPPPRKTDGSFLFDVFRVAPTLFDPPNVTPMAEIKNGLGRNGGKGMVYNVEVSGTYGTWTGGNPMNIWLGGTQSAPKSYRELYLRFYLKYPLEWAWTSDSNPITNRGAMQKVMKIVRYNGYLGDGGNPQLYVGPAGGGRNHPLWSMQWSQYISTTPSYTIFNNVERLSPDYSAGGTNVFREFTWPTDGEWHCYDFHARMNSIPGLPDGGLEEIWVDGALKFRKENVVFVKADGTVDMGWNMVEVLDNVTLPAFPLASQVTLPLYVDDVVVSTDYRGPPAAPVNVSVQQLHSSGVNVRWEGGANGAAFQLDGYQIHYGTSPTALTNVVRVGNVTAKEISGLQPGETYYFAVSAYNQAAGDPNENRSVRSPMVSLSVN